MYFEGKKRRQAKKAAAGTAAREEESRIDFCASPDVCAESCGRRKRMDGGIRVQMERHFCCSINVQ